MYGYKFSIHKFIYHLILFFIITGNIVLATDPVGGDTSMTMLEDQVHTFTENEFPFSDSDGHSFAGIQIITVESAGDLEYNGTDVATNTIAADVTQLVFSPDLNANGVPYTTFVFKLIDSNGEYSTATYIMTINVTAVNDIPTITQVSDPSAILEDAGAQTISLSGIGDGDLDATQTITVTATSNNTSLIPDPAVSDNATWSLAYTPVSNANGTADITVTVSDNGGTDNGGVNSATMTFTVNVTAVNDIPSYSLGANQSVDEDGGSQTVSNWATDISSGPSDESEQALTFSLSNDNNSLFVSQPSVSSNGDLSYTPADDAHGNAIVTIYLSDDGGTANGGVDETSNSTFTIEVVPVADTPSITNASTLEDTQSSSGLLISRNAVDGDEVTHFKITGITNGSLYQQDGVTGISNNAFITYAQGSAGLRFSPDDDFNGDGSFMIQAATGASSDSLGGLSVSATIEVIAVNDIPIVFDSSYTVLEDSSITFYLFSNDGDTTNTVADIQSVTYFIDSSTVFGQLFPPAEDGEIVYTPEENWNGFDSFTYYVVDDGGTENDGINTSLPATIEITINPVNDPPVITPFLYPYQDTLIYSDIYGSGSVQLRARITDFDSDSISFTWFDMNEDTTIIINEYDLEDSTALDIINYTLTAGENNIRVVVSDNGETNGTLIDTVVQSDSDSTRIDMGNPSLTSGDHQVFVKHDGARELLPVTIHNGIIDSTINIINNLIVALPEDIPFKWTNIDSISTSDDFLIQIPPTMSSDSSKLIFNILTDFDSSNSITLTGLALTGFDSILEQTRLRLIVDGNELYSTANSMDDYTFWVGSPVIAVNTNDPSNNYMIKNNIYPDSSWFGEIMISNGPIDSTFHKDDTISIKIPDELHAQWGDSINVSDSEKIKFIPSSNTKVISFRILHNYLENETETISVEFILDASSYNKNIFLGGIGNERYTITFPDSSEEIIGIGDPDVSSGSDQIFVVGDSPKTINTISYAEDGFSPSLTGHPNLFIKIPENFNAQWSALMDSESIEISDQGGAIINITSLEFFYDNSVIKLSLNADYFTNSWTAEDTLFITNLSFSDFNDPTDGPYYLNISALADDNYHDLDMKNIQIGRPKLIIGNNQTFLYNDIERLIDTISIYDDPLVNTINNGNGILIVLPDNYPATWIVPDNIEFSGSYNGNIDSMMVKGMDKDTLQIYISDDFIPGDSIIFSNIMVGNFSATSYNENSFKLSVRGGAINFPFYESDTTSWIKTGRPDISIPNDFAVLLGNNSSIQVPPITIREDNTAPVINTQRQYLTVSVPQETGMLWDSAVPITFLTGSAIGKVSYQPIYSGRHASFEIYEDFSTADSIIIAGLYLNAPISEIDTVLSISLNEGDTDCDWTQYGITVGIVSFSSGDDQFFFRNTDETYRELYPITINQGSENIFSDKLIFRIPNELQAEWDSVLTIAQINIFSTSGNSIYDEIEFSLNGKDLIFNGVSFEAAADVIIDGLYFSADKSESLPLNVSSSDTLLLVLDGYINSLVINDGYQKAIGGPTITSIRNSNFIVGENEPFSKLDTIIIIEDELISGLAIFDSLNIIIPEIIGDTFQWSSNDQLFVNGTYPTSISYNGNIASIPLDESITGNLAPGDTIEIWGLGFSEIIYEHPGFSLSFDLIGESTTPIITDTALVYSGNLSLELADDIEFPLGLQSQYLIPDIVINESSLNLLDQRRSVVLTLSDDLGAITNWSLTNMAIQEQVACINTVEINGDTLTLSFKDTLPNGELTLAGLFLTIDEIFYSNPVDADSLIKYFKLTDGHINLHTERIDVGFNPFIVDSTSNGIQFFPPVILDKPEVYYNENNIISFPSSPGLLEGETSLNPSQFQLVRSWSPYGDTLLFSNESESSVTINHLVWNMNDAIQINNMPFVTINLSDQDLLKMNRWFDEAGFHNRSFSYHLSVNKNLLTQVDLLDPETRFTDTSGVEWLHYNPRDIVFSQSDRIISQSELQDFTLSLGAIDLNELQFSLIGVLTHLDTSIIFDPVDSSITLGNYFHTLAEDLYIIRVGSNQNNLKGMTPIIRQFIMDNSSPEIVSIFPLSGKSIYGGGHEVSILENITVSYFDNLSIENQSDTFNIRFGLTDTILSTKFPFPDSLLFNINMNWSSGIDYSNQQTTQILVDRSNTDTTSWSVSFDSLLSLLNKDSMNYNMLDQINSHINFTLNDHTALVDTGSVEYKILLTDSSPIGKEVFNYPNPFSSIKGQNTTIRYTIHREGMTGGEFIIFDAGGDIVFFNNILNLSIGTHDDLIWDGTDLNGNKLSSGVYFGYLKTKNTSFKNIIISILNE